MVKLSLTKLFHPSLIGLVGAIALSSFASTSLAQVSPNPTPTPDHLIAQTLTAQDIQNRLVGHWQIQGIFFVPVTVIFTAEGKGFLLVPASSINTVESPIAYEFTYRINNATQPLQIDIAQPGEEAVKTIFEFTNDGRIRAELLGIKAGEPRPTEFTTGAFFLNRVSGITALPRNTIISNSLEVVRKAREELGKRTIRSFLEGEQAYQREKDVFTTDLKILGIWVRDERDIHYIYQAIPSNNLQQEVFITATAMKPGIRSFIGAVFVVRDGDREATQIGGICETSSPSMTPPAPPILNGREIQCAPGSRPPDRGNQIPPFNF